MSNNIDKFRIEERIRISYLKHRGKVLKVAAELGIPIEHVKKVAKKIKGSIQRDVALWVAQSVMTHLLDGYQQRVALIEQGLDKLGDSVMMDRISKCCRAAVVSKEYKSDKEYQCALCSKACYVDEVAKAGVFNLRHDAINMLREEDLALMEFAVKMGYSEKQEPAIQHIQQNIIQVGGVKLSQDENDALISANDMSPRDREKLRKGLQKSLLDSASLVAD